MVTTDVVCFTDVIDECSLGIVDESQERVKP